MKKSKIYMGVLLLCIILFLISYLISGNFYISSLFFIVPLYLYIISSIVLKKKRIIEDEKVSKASTSIKKVLEINNEFSFLGISKKKHYISENNNICNYLDDDVDFLRTDIENSIHNISIYDKYMKSISEICDIDSILNLNDNIKKIDEIMHSVNDVGYSNKKFRKIERRVLNKLIHKREDCITSVDLQYVNYDIDNLINIYNDWLKSNSCYNVISCDEFNCRLNSTNAFSSKLVIGEDSFLRLTNL